MCAHVRTSFVTEAVSLGINQGRFAQAPHPVEAHHRCLLASCIGGFVRSAFELDLVHDAIADILVSVVPLGTPVVHGQVGTLASGVIEAHVLGDLGVRELSLVEAEVAQVLGSIHALLLFLRGELLVARAARGHAMPGLRVALARAALEHTANQVLRRHGGLEHLGENQKHLPEGVDVLAG
jgi:hypothetical protein